MSYEQRIYVDYDDYDMLEEVYPTDYDFRTAINSLVNNSSYTLTWLIDSGSLDELKIRTFVVALSYPIYKEYCRDRIAFKDEDYFIQRLTNVLVRQVNKWYSQMKVEMDLILNSTLEKYRGNGGTKSETSENAQTGSAVIQKSASTPTGITHSTSAEDIDMTLEHTPTSHQTSMGVDDNYDDKYTNFVGKTNGVHRNEVDRETEITRTSNYGMALDILEKIPYSYINDVIRAVSDLFIEVY